MTRNPILKAVVAGGLLGGALDLLFAIALAASKGTPPVKLLCFIASGVLGKAAFSGGTAVAALGLACHFVCSLGWAALLALVVTRLPTLARRPLVLGAVFGIVIFLCMRLIVVPLSAVPIVLSFKPLAGSLDLLSHMFLFGTPISLAVCRAIKSLAAPAPSPAAS